MREKFCDNCDGRYIPAGAKGAAVTSPQRAALSAQAEFLEPVPLRTIDFCRDAVPNGAWGIYAFLRAQNGKCPRIYLGMAERCLLERTYRQLSERRWATMVLVYCLPDLCFCTVKILESRLLNSGREWLPAAIWDNVQGLPPLGRPACPARFYDPELLGISTIIENSIQGAIRRSTVLDTIHNAEPTLLLGSSSGDLLGRILKQGKQTYILPGSRLTASIPNFAAMRRDGTAFALWSKYYWEGCLQWRKATLNRPAGFVVTEKIKQNSLEQATAFLVVVR